MSSGNIIQNMNYNNFHEKVAKKIKHLRESKNMTQEDMEEGPFGINVCTYQSFNY